MQLIRKYLGGGWGGGGLDSCAQTGQSSSMLDAKSIMNGLRQCGQDSMLVGKAFKKSEMKLSTARNSVDASHLN